MLTASLATRPARAAGCPAPGRPFVDVGVEVKPPDVVIATTLVAHLRAELAGRQIDVCEGATAGGHLARVRLQVRRDEAGAVVARIALEDRLLRKEVSREIDLTPLPDDVRPTTVATAADELLRAAWTELTLGDAPAPSAPPPAAVVEAVRATQTRPLTPLPIEGGALALASVSGHRTSLGGGLLGYLWLWPHLGLTARMEATRGLSVSSTHGHARLDTLAFGLGPVVSPWSVRRRAGVRLEPLVQATLALPSGDAAPGATARDGATSTLDLSLGARGWLRAGDLVLTAGLGVSYTLRPVRASDESSTVTALEGIAGSLSIGVMAMR